MPADHSYGLLSLLPPGIAILLAMVSRRVVLSLLLGILVGGAILAEGNPWHATAIVLEGHLWPALANDNHLRVFAFTSLMGGMIGVITRSGGMRAILDWLTPLARTRQRCQLVTWMSGLFIFFDDYANTLLLGSTMRPLADRTSVSREKLAYIVDSTAAPVAGLAIVSTWVAAEIGYIAIK